MSHPRAFFTPGASAALLAALGSLCFSSAAHAASAVSGKWATTEDGSWASASNWVDGVAPGGADSIVTFDTAIPDTRHVRVDAGRTAGHLVFASKQQWQLVGESLTLAVAGIDESPTITVNNGHPFVTALAGSQGFVKRGGSNLYLPGNNTYAGVTYVYAGQVYAMKDRSLGATGPGNNTVIAHTGQLHVSRGANIEEEIVLLRLEPGDSTLLYNDSGDNTLSGPLVLQRGGRSGRTHVFGVQVTGGSLTLAGPAAGKLGPEARPGDTGGEANVLRVRVKEKAAFTFAGGLSDGDIGGGGLALQKTDPGVLRLLAPATHTGGTIITAGALLANNPRGSGTGAGPVQVRDGATLGGVGVVAPSGDASVVFAPGSILAPGVIDASGAGVAAAEKLTLALSPGAGRVTFQGGATLAIDLNPAARGVAERVEVTGLEAGRPRVFFNDTVVNIGLVPGATLAPGVYPIFHFDASDAYSGRLVLGRGLEGHVASLLHEADGVSLKIERRP